MGRRAAFKWRPCESLAASAVGLARWDQNVNVVVSTGHNMLVWQVFVAACTPRCYLRGISALLVWQTFRVKVGRSCGTNWPQLTVDSLRALCGPECSGDRQDRSRVALHRTVALSRCAVRYCTAPPSALSTAEITLSQLAPKNSFPLTRSRLCPVPLTPIPVWAKASNRCRVQNLAPKNSFPPTGSRIKDTLVRLLASHRCHAQSAPPRLHRDWGSPLPRLHRDWGSPLPRCTGTGAHPCHICTGTGYYCAVGQPMCALPARAAARLSGAGRRVALRLDVLHSHGTRRCRRRPSCRWSMRRSAMLAWSRTYAVLCAHLRLGLRDCTRLGFRDGAYSSRGRSQRGHSRSPPAACAAPELRRVALAALRVQHTT